MTSLNIKKAEELYNAKYVGLYDLPDREGPFHVFYQKEVPEKFRDDPKYDNYLALFLRPVNPYDIDGAWSVYVTGARSIRDAEFPAIKLQHGEGFLVSRYRHNYVSSPSGHAFLDGGLAYTRCNPSHPPTHMMRIVDGNEVYTPIKERKRGTVAADDVPEDREATGKGAGKRRGRKQDASGPIYDRRVPVSPKGRSRSRSSAKKDTGKNSRATARVGGGA